ncbi:hypothetical protein F3Y22_tig00112159pilonHSYRG00377 [Hibiscus syriacus]|uniref:Uncharacterized protein n=1 Tax=Hibiscus syriacus TaxID=106335 RepID=A0A6A2X5E0_HIBSY|nr:hypothetical protein F3Y22_tig00112159pilonHSYRG00377 [Hibiscus syriacus]
MKQIVGISIVGISLRVSNRGRGRDFCYFGFTVIAAVADAIAAVAGNSDGGETAISRPKSRSHTTERRTKSSSKTASPSSTSISDRTLTGLGNLIKLLPTGTVFVFQFLNPVLTNYGHCSPVNKVLTSILIALCGFSCAFSCFTDSYEDGDGRVHYGIAIVNGLWPSSGSVGLSKYKLRVGDFVHVFFSVIVFAVLSLLDSNQSFKSRSRFWLFRIYHDCGRRGVSIRLLSPPRRFCSWFCRRLTERFRDRFSSCFRTHDMVLATLRLRRVMCRRTHRTATRMDLLRR